MSANSWAFHPVSVAIVLLLISIPMGLFFWAILVAAGLAAIEGGLQGFRFDGYVIHGDVRLQGRFARLAGGFALTLGILWEMMLLAILLLGPSRL